MLDISFQFHVNKDGTFCNDFSKGWNVTLATNNLKSMENVEMGMPLYTVQTEVIAKSIIFVQMKLLEMSKHSMRGTLGMDMTVHILHLVRTPVSPVLRS